ncbi:trypsin-like peptidase domain-containing protein [Patescibacteria group bacterium]|nr:trypsin-like peptidase domain-containing protein [Patescibacteria group bacterium]
MGTYDLPEIKINWKKKRDKNFRFLSLVVSLSIFFGFLAGIFSSGFFYFRINSYLEKLNIDSTKTIEKSIESQEEVVINVVKNSSPAVVSIVITKDLGTEKREVGGGTGFIVSEDGLILTNKHVVLDDNAEYAVFTNKGKKFTAKVIAKDPFQDLAIIKISQEDEMDENGNLIINKFPILNLGNSDELQIGQSVIAIGNALAEFNNTVSAGLVSGLGRRITATGNDSFVETLNDVIQTDAGINKGNSGGPLLNLKGEVIGINTAIALDAQSIGFAIPINYAKRDIKQIKETGKIVYPFIGIRYVLVNEELKEQEELSVDYGILIVDGGADLPPITPGSPASETELAKGDVILELNGEIITADNNLAKILMDYNPGDEITLKVLKNGNAEEIEVKLTLAERKE